MTNREIKFRFWSPRMQKFYYSRMHGTISSERHSDKYGDSCPTQFPFVIENFPCPTDYIQQYTGLKDKNEKDIYEGDFVTLRTVAHDYHTTVVFEGGCFAFKVNNPQGTLSLVFAHLIDSGHFEAEVFGNRFEGDQPDPEVLGKYSPK